MDEEIIGQCCECGADCTDRDLVGNQTEMGFPVLWCSKCIDRHLTYDIWKARFKVLGNILGIIAVIGFALWLLTR